MLKRGRLGAYPRTMGFMSSDRHWHGRCHIAVTILGRRRPGYVKCVPATMLWTSVPREPLVAGKDCNEEPGLIVANWGQAMECTTARFSRSRELRSRVRLELGSALPDGASGTSRFRRRPDLTERETRVVSSALIPAQKPDQRGNCICRTFADISNGFGSPSATLFVRVLECC